MDHIPVGSLLLLVVVDVLMVEAYSVTFGAVVARAAGRSVVIGALVGLLLPVVGPLVWAVVVLAQDHELAKVRRSAALAPTTVVCAGLCLLAGALLAGATPLQWGAVSGSFQTYALASDATPADTGIGLFATLGSAAVLIALVPLLLFSTSRRRVSMVLGMVSGLWLLLTVDALIVFSALDGLSSFAAGASGGRAEVHAAPEAALYLCLAGGLVAAAAAVLALVAPPVHPIAAATPAPADPVPGIDRGGWGAPPVSPASPPSAPGSGWGSPTSGTPTAPSSHDWTLRS